jgi:hypothetical protein
LIEPWPISAWPDAARSVILARDDRRFASMPAHEAGRLILDGAEPILIDGSHSPFLSRPAELAASTSQAPTSDRRRSASNTPLM